MEMKRIHINLPEDVHNALADAQFQADILIALLDDARSGHEAK